MHRGVARARESEGSHEDLHARKHWKESQGRVARAGREGGGGARQDRREGGQGKGTKRPGGRTLSRRFRRGVEWSVSRPTTLLCGGGDGGCSLTLLPTLLLLKQMVTADGVLSPPTTILRGGGDGCSLTRLLLLLLLLKQMVAADGGCRLCGYNCGRCRICRKISLRLLCTGTVYIDATLCNRPSPPPPRIQLPTKFRYKPSTSAIWDLFFQAGLLSSELSTSRDRCSFHKKGGEGDYVEVRKGWCVESGASKHVTRSKKYIYMKISVETQQARQKERKQ